MSHWHPGLDQATLVKRARMLRSIRTYFLEQDVLETTTPLLAETGVTDPYIENLSLASLGKIHYLQTSPEYAMKRLLASGSGSIYQICPAFRAAEVGRKHNIEFTMLEWYRLNFDLDALMLDTERLLSRVSLDVQVGCFNEFRRISYRSLFEQYFGANPHTLGLTQLRELAGQWRVDCTHIAEHDDAATCAAYLDCLFATLIGPDLLTATLVFDFPACQVALAQMQEVDGHQIARRFEVYAAGVELGNGYHELGDAAELRTRMDCNNAMREVRGLTRIAPDERLLAALGEMPACSGIAVGVDRLLMVLLNRQTLKEVIGFVGERG